MPPFVASEWLGCGKIFSDLESPECVTAELEKLLRVPQSFDANLLDHSRPVNDLLQLISVPRVDIKSPWTLASFSFDSGAPVSLDHLPVNFSRRPVPPRKISEQLRSSVGQAWFDGAKSILIHPDKTLFPFWIVTYWINVNDLVALRSEWLRAERWLEQQLQRANCVQSASLLAHMQGLFGTMRWTGKMLGDSWAIQTSDLTQVLSSEPLKGDVIDSFVRLVRTRIRRSGLLQKKVAVEDLRVIDYLRKPAHQWAHYSPETFPILHRIGSQMQSGLIRQLYFPLCIKDCHWAVLSIDIAGRTIHYGDSLEWRTPTSDIEAVQTWLSHHELSGFTIGQALPHGVQLDGFSCGVAAINTIEHAIFGDELWSPAKREQLRVQKALDLISSDQEYVRVLIYISFSS